MAKKKRKKSTPSSLLVRAETTREISSNYAGRIVQVFQNVDLRNGVDGLLRVAADNGMDLDKLPTGHYPVFINSQKDRFIILSRSKSGRGWIITYYKSYDGRITRDEMQEVPQSFGLKRDLQISDKLSSKLDEELRMKRSRSLN